MPYSKLHQQKKVKNYTLLVVLLSIIAILFVVAMVKMSNSGMVS